jgi:hypothetical protein
MRRLVRSRTYYRMKNKKDSRERKTLIACRALFPNDVYCYLGYYSWLPGVTGEPLQIDIFFPELGCLGGKPLAIEVQGEQHRKRIKFFAKTEEDFERQKENDKRKKAILNGKNIPFIEIWPENDISPQGIKAKIEETLGTEIINA